jgi:hypothetical protein
VTGARPNPADGPCTRRLAVPELSSTAHPPAPSTNPDKPNSQLPGRAPVLGGNGREAGAERYLKHHLALAGRSDPLFSDDAVQLIHTTGRGLPRAVNNLAVQALLDVFIQNKTIVDEASTRAAVAEVTTE